MEKYLYSASDNAFYSAYELHIYEEAGTLPSDLVGVDVSVFLEFSQQKNGFNRMSGPDGMPVWEKIAEQVPMLISRAQGKMALIKSGEWGKVIDFVGSIENQEEKQIADVVLGDAATWRRDSDILNNIFRGAGMDPIEIDAVFQYASEIKF